MGASVLGRLPATRRETGRAEIAALGRHTGSGNAPDATESVRPGGQSGSEKVCEAGPLQINSRSLR